MRSVRAEPILVQLKFMDGLTHELKMAADVIVAEIRRLLANRGTPIVVALDGGSGSGKSTLASLIARELPAALITGDDFFAADITDAVWERRSPQARAADAMDWRRLRAEALEPLLAGKSAKWHALDFEAGVRPNGTYALRMDFVEREPRTVIVLDGAYSTRPELADLIDLSVLVDAPVGMRHERLATREDGSFLASWHARWDEAEEYYFKHLRPKSSFDLVVVNHARLTKVSFETRPWGSVLFPFRALYIHLCSIMTSWICASAGLIGMKGTAGNVKNTVFRLRRSKLSLRTHLALRPTRSIRRRRIA